MRTRLPRTVAVAVAVLLLVVPACSENEPEQPESSGPAETVTEVTVEPGTATGFEGARTDVTDVTCERGDDRWTVTGTVRNPTGKAADYRIYTSFLDDGNETRGLVQTDVPDLAPEQEQEWEDELQIGGEDLRCVLRVERTPAG